ncbi:hypothetical protein [Novipirellula artificiosorum]|uniref:Uncharacterized protein n=1 Tax=Novipirellula artificiosorum TaxID=2528016 RepID=A0A5C6DYZ5_9BACT|nr:hypothetical protein [Novipirellula artificiosorum]TWU41870.1 hypothetical protein Poly41_01630 [Novipirellula artificiosorum]
MGWLFIPGSVRRSMIKDRTSAWERTNDDGTTIKTTCLAHCFRGNCFSGVLWSVFERTFIQDGEHTESQQRWIQCDLLQYSRSDDGWGYKDMDESMHPYYYSCPKSYLDMVPVETHGGNAEWREHVRQHHRNSLAKRRAKRTAKAR